MPVAGRKQKPEEERRNRVKPVHDWIEVENVPYTGPVPRLPNRYGMDPETFLSIPIKYPARTQAWWAVISRMPHCVLWTESDWQHALDCVELHARFMERYPGASNELRMRQKQLGITMDDRRDLRIRYVEPRTEPEQSGRVIQLADYVDL